MAYNPPRTNAEPPYIEFESDCPPGVIAAKLVGPSGRWSFRLMGRADRWKDRHTLLLWELLQDVIADEEMEREVPNLSVVRAETDLRLAFSAARRAASEPAPAPAPIALHGR